MDKYQITFDTWNKIAAVYESKFMELALYNDSYDLFCELVPKPNASVFEIGCGPGNVTNYLSTKRPDFKIEAIDIAPEMIKLAQKNNPEAAFQVMDCREIASVQKKFDAVICGFIMPYLTKTDCAKLIKDSANLLNSNGILYFSTIEGDYEKSGFETGSTGDKMFVYYHQENYLLNYLSENNFELLHLIRKEYPKSAGTSDVHLIFIARKVSETES